MLLSYYIDKTFKMNIFAATITENEGHCAEIAQLCQEKVEKKSSKDKRIKYKYIVTEGNLG